MFLCSHLLPSSHLTVLLTCASLPLGIVNHLTPFCSQEAQRAIWRLMSRVFLAADVVPRSFPGSPSTKRISEDRESSAGAASAS